MQNKTHVSPEELGELIAGLSTFTPEEKQGLLESLPYMNVAAIEALYKKLIDYKKLENQSLSEIEQIDLKYILLAQQEIEKIDINNPPKE